MNIYNYKGFALQRKNISCYEEQTVCTSAALNKIPFKIFQDGKDVPKDLIPVGDCKFVQSVLGRKIIPNYYPIQLEQYLRRKVWHSDRWPLKRVFVKPSDQYKRFTGFVTNGTYRGKKKGPYILSDIIQIKNEWRYYLGTKMDGFWYSGQDEEKIAPTLPDFPKMEYNIGCLDMGETFDGELILIEWQHPFSCGWYGKGVNDGEEYTQWLIDGYMEIGNGSRV
jgi:hypothetical protein